LLHAQVRLAKPFDPSARDDAKPTHLRELRQDIVVKAVDEEHIRVNIAAVLERQHGY